MKQRILYLKYVNYLQLLFYLFLFCTFIYFVIIHKHKHKDKDKDKYQENFTTPRQIRETYRPLVRNSRILYESMSNEYGPFVNDMLRKLYLY
jgi:Ca2+/Na+ antiporter